MENKLDFLSKYLRSEDKFIQENHNRVSSLLPIIDLLFLYDSHISETDLESVIEKIKKGGIVIVNSTNHGDASETLSKKLTLIGVIDRYNDFIIENLDPYDKPLTLKEITELGNESKCEPGVIDEYLTYKIKPESFTFPGHVRPFKKSAEMYFYKK
jgi:hypothetical protein